MLDTNILIYHLVQNHADHSAAASRLMMDVRLGREDVYCPATAISECCYVLEKTFAAPRHEISPLIADIVSLQGVRCESKSALLSALAFWQLQSALDFPDCYHLALAKDLGITQIYTFDRKMDRFPGVERIEPD